MQLFVACTTVGYVASYWNIAFYPEWCSNVELDDIQTYNTVVRVSGAWAGIADAFKEVLDFYGWRRTVFLSNEAPGPCYFGGVPIKALLSTAENFTFYWINMAPVPTDAEIEDYLHQIRIRTRGWFFLVHAVYTQYRTFESAVFLLRFFLVI